MSRQSLARMARIALTVRMALLGLALLLWLPGAAEAASAGTVVGTIVLDGKETKLRHIFAQRREARPADRLRFQLKDGETLDAGVVDLIATERPFAEADIADLIDFRYQGTAARGLWLILDLSNSHSARSYFLTESGALPTAMGTSMSSAEGSAQVEHGRLTGKLAARIQEVSSLKTYQILFDAPVHLRPYDVDPATPTLAPEELAGAWVIERWWGEGGTTTTGTLRIDDGATTGTFRFPVSDDLVIEELVVITREGSRFHLQGSVTPGTRWSPDTLDLELRGDLLIGAGQDAAGVHEDVVLRKQP